MMRNDANNLRRAAVAEPLDVAPFHPPSSAVGLEIGAKSVCGRLRAHNTDHYLAIRIDRRQETLLTSLAAADLPSHFEESGFALLVADGVDGGGGGARASRLALSALAYLAIEHGKWNVRVTPDISTDIMEQIAFFSRRANDALREASRSDSKGSNLATSVTAVYIAGADLFFGHVGHSNPYLFRSGSLIKLTGHARGERCDSEHEVTGMVGGSSHGPDLDIEHIQLSSGDRILLCTNGLTDGVNDDEIADALSLRRKPDEDCQHLVDLALTGQSTDDVTVMLADFRLLPMQ